MCFYLTHDSDLAVVAFTVDDAHVDRDEILGLPLVPYSRLAADYPASDYAMFVAVGYARVNRLRSEICERARAAGYELISYVSSKTTTWPGLEIGDNCFIFEDNTIQPFSRIGDDVIMWSGNHLGHHSTIGDHCFVTSHVVISGNVTVGPFSFIGVNATIRDSISIGEANVIGAAAIIMKSTKDREVYIAPRTKPDARTSEEIGM